MLSFQAIGALVGMSIAGAAISRFSARLLTVSLSLGALLLIALALNVEALVTASVIMVFVGFTLGFSCSGAVALAGALFPADVRCGGLGFAMAAVRIGQILLPGAMGLLLASHAAIVLLMIITAVIPILGGITAYGLGAIDAKDDSSSVHFV